MATFEALFGKELVDAEGKVYQTSEKLQKTYVAVYFSALWCGPCRAFSPKLKEIYKKLKEMGKNFEVVFSSWDSDAPSFKEYFGKMPWLAIPFENAAARENLKAKFRVTGIPTLLMLGPNGELINENARELMENDLECANYPWSPKTIYELIDTTLLKGVKGQTVPGSSLKGHIFGLYFSAGWCPSCRKFTPQLKSVYSKLQAQGKDFEVIYCYRDKEEDGFQDYYGEMPWLSIPFGKDALRDEILVSQGVKTIPCLVLFDEKGNRIRYDGRDAVEANPEGYPWLPPPMLLMENGPEEINTQPCVVLLTPDSHLKAIFERVSVEQKKDGVAFVYGAVESSVAAQIRGLTHQEQMPCLMVIDIPQDGAYYAYTGGEITYESLTAFVKDYFKGDIPRSQMG